MFVMSFVMHIVLHQHDNLKRNVRIHHSERFSYLDKCSAKAASLADTYKRYAKDRLSHANVEVKWACTRAETYPV